jgi:hypothetical protein
MPLAISRSLRAGVTAPLQRSTLTEAAVMIEHVFVSLGTLLHHRLSDVSVAVLEGVGFVC